MASVKNEVLLITLSFKDHQNPNFEYSFYGVIFDNQDKFSAQNLVEKFDYDKFE